MRKHAAAADVADGTLPMLWKVPIANAQTCVFPRMTDKVNDSNSWRQIPVDVGFALHTGNVNQAAKPGGATLPSVLTAAWALVLGYYTGLENVSFSSAIYKNGGYRMNIFEADLGDDLSVDRLLRQFERQSRSRVDMGEGSNEYPSTEQSLEIVHVDNAVLLREKDTEFFKNDELDKFNIVVDIELLAPVKIPTSSNYVKHQDILAPATAGYKEANITINYRESILSDERAAGLASTFGNAIIGILDEAQAERPAKCLRLLSERDREQVFTWNNKTLSAVDGCIHDIFEQQLLVTPDAPAISAWDANYTFKELNGYALRLAKYLVNLGVGPEALVPLCFDKSALTIVSMLAVMKAGGGYVLIDSSLPIDRIRTMVTDTEANIVLVAEQHAHIFKNYVETIVSVNSAILEDLPSDVAVTWPAANPGNVAYVVFTSGSTGKPKGVVIEHRSFSTMAAANGPTLGIGKETRSLQFASYAFDAANLEVFITLIHGGCVCIPSESERVNDLAGFINRHRVNWLLLTPSVASLLHPKDVPTLLNLVLGGEAPKNDVVDDWIDYVTLINAYGPAECTIVTTISHFDRHTAVSTIGRGNASLLWIVDSSNHDRLCPIGGLGELVVEGPIVGRGYLQDAEKTRLAFIENPKWLRDSSGAIRRFYKTGDLVRYNSDGSVLYVGRRDSQIKLHGQRLEIRETEHHIASHQAVKHSTVIFPHIGPAKGKLVAILSLKNLELGDLAPSQEEQKITFVGIDHRGFVGPKLSEVCRSLAEKLPAYMVPAVWIILESIPLTLSGKINKQALTNWVKGLDHDDWHHISSIWTEDVLEKSAPVSEQQLVRIISYVLNLPEDQVTLESSFFDLGGDSITAMQVLVKCRAEGMAFSVKDIMTSKTISQLALSAKSEQQNHIPKEEFFDIPFDLSPIQHFYFKELHDYPPEIQVPSFNQGFLLRLTRKIQIPNVASAIDAIVSRHSMLRARYTKSADGNWTQRVLSGVKDTYRFAVHEVQNLREVLVTCAASHDTMDIENGPVFSVDHFDIMGQNQLLFIVAHHLVIDLMSWRVIIKDLETLLLGGRLSSQPLPFQTWIWLQAEHARRHLSPLKTLPYEVPSANYGYWGMEGEINVIGDTSNVTFSIDQEKIQLLFKNYHRASRAEPLDVLIASLLHSFNKTFRDRSAPVIFSEGHGREPWSSQIDLSETVGWFTTIYPLQVQEKADLDQLVRLIKDQRRSLPNKGWSYFTCRYLNEDGKKSFYHHHPMEIILNYIGHYQQFDRTDALLQLEDSGSVDTSAIHNTDKQYRLALFEIGIDVLAGKAHFSICYNRRTRHQDKIMQWIDLWQHWLRQTAADLQQTTLQYTLSDFPMTSLTSPGLEKINTRVQQSPKQWEIEDIYPCSPVQQGILISQGKTSSIYKTRWIFRAFSVAGSVNIPKLQCAWGKVVNRHPILRTVFMERVSRAPFDQLVLKTFEPLVVKLHANNEDACAIIEQKSPCEYDDSRPSHELTICDTPCGDVYIMLEISHALMDGTSMGLVKRDLVLAYDDKLPAIPGPLYSEYISYLQQRPVDQSLKYWSSYLEGVKPCHFPVLNDGIDEPNRTLNVEVDLTPHAVAFREFCKEHKVTVANILQTAWGIVLRSFLDNDQICFGYIASGREVPVNGIEDAVGPYINMLICRMGMGEKITLSQLVEKRKEEYLQSLPYQHLALAEIQHALKLSNRPLFNTILSIQRDSKTPSDDSTISFSQRSGQDPSEYGISINIGFDDDGVSMALHYMTSILSEGQAANVAHRFDRALASILKSPNTQISHLSLFGEFDLKQILKWNDSWPEVIDQTLHAVISEKAKECPNSQALRSTNESFTYAELESLSTRLAHHLADLGVGPEILVPVFFEKSVWAIISMIAILKAGGAFVPLDPASSKERLQLLLSEVGAKIALTSPKMFQKLDKIVDQVVTVSRGMSSWLPENERPVKSGVTPDNVVYTIFTSGSTGKPKGVIIEHRAAITSLVHLCERLCWSAKSRIFQFTAFTFDFSIIEIFGSLILGGCLCVPSDEERLGGISRTMTELKVNTAVFTPSVVRVIRPDDVPGLQNLAIGGEAIGSDNVETWGDKVSLHCLYGPAEACIACVHTPLGQKHVRFDVIGRAVASLSWIVLPNDYNQLAPVGTVGELVVQGHDLAREYLNDKERTAKVFIDNATWVPENGRPRRIYKTGDLVRYNSNGTITFLGRKDAQVKLRGQIIHLGEIEHHVTTRLSDAKQIAIDVIAPGELNERRAIAAFIYMGDKPNTNSGLDALPIPLTDTLRVKLTEAMASLAEDLPSNMLPLYYIPMSSMPRRAAGKLNRKELVQIASQMPGAQLKQYLLSKTMKRPPSTDMEKRLRDLWHKILGTEDIGADDNFFALGGDSILSMQLAAEASRVGLSLTVAKILQHPRLSAIAALLEKGHNPDNTTYMIRPLDLVQGVDAMDPFLEKLATQCNVKKNLIQDVYPCTPLQEGFMSLSVLQPGTCMVQRVLRLPDALDLDRFKNAWQEATNAHPILRTRIMHTAEQGSLQIVLKKEPLQWRTTKSLDKSIEEDLEDPLSYGEPIVRYNMVKENGCTYFILTIHHALYDGWSLPLIFEHVEKVYRGEKVSTPVPFLRYISYLVKADRIGTRSYWASQFSKNQPAIFPPLPSPGYRPLANSTAHHKIHVSRTARSNVTISTILRAAWALVASKYSESGDIVFGATMSGRAAPVSGIEFIIGPTISTVPIRICIDGNQSAMSYLEAVQKQASDMIPFEYFGLQNIANLGEAARASTNFQTLLVIQPAAKTSVEQKFLGADLLLRPRPESITYALVIECQLNEEGANIHAHHDCVVLASDRVHMMLHQFDHVARQLSDAPEQLLESISFFSEQDRLKLEEWNQEYLGDQNPPCPLSDDELKKYGFDSSKGISCWIADPLNNKELAPIGLTGELVLGGPAIDNASVKRSAEADGSFVPAPAWLQKSDVEVPQWLYKTGNLARYNSDGIIQLIGHKDSQIVLHGHRMNLTVIEHEIMQNDTMVRRVSIRVVTYNGDQTLAAFVCFENSGRGTPVSEDIEPCECSELRVRLEVLKSKLYQSLELHMIPSFYIPVTHIPSTVAGIVDHSKFRTFLMSLSSESLESYMIC